MPVLPRPVSQPCFKLTAAVFKFTGKFFLVRPCQCLTLNPSQLDSDSEFASLSCYMSISDSARKSRVAAGT